MKRFLLHLEELAIALAVAISLGTFSYSTSIIYGSRIILIAQTIATAIVWFIPALILVWILEYFIKTGRNSVNIETSRRQALVAQRPLYLCYLALFQPILTYNSFGLALLLFSALAILWRQGSLIAEASKFLRNITKTESNESSFSRIKTFLSLLIPLLLLLLLTILNTYTELSWLSTPFIDMAPFVPALRLNALSIIFLIVWIAAFTRLLLWFISAKRRDGKKVCINLTGIGPIVLTLFLFALAVFLKTPHLQDKPFIHQDSGSSIWFENGTVFVEPQSFWIKTGATEFCYFINDQPIENVLLRMRTQSPNIVKISRGGESTQFRLIDKSTAEYTLFLPEGFFVAGKWVGRISITSEGGNPAGLVTDGSDSRPLGVEISIEQVFFRRW